MFTVNAVDYCTSLPHDFPMWKDDANDSDKRDLAKAERLIDKGRGYVAEGNKIRQRVKQRILARTRRAKAKENGDE